MKARLLRMAGWLSGEGAVLLAYAAVLAVVAEPLWRVLLFAGGR